MNAAIAYLDSSAIVKRYVSEPSSDVVRALYIKAYAGDVKIAFSLWNVGEVLGVFDRARRLGRMDKHEYNITKKRFLGETKRMMKLGIAVILPVKVRVLMEAWKLAEKHHVYVADALQIASAKHVKAEKFLTGDRRLHEIAMTERLNSTLLSNP